MALLGNLIWFLTGGLLVGLIYLLGAIVLFPLLPFLLPLISYSFLPFGRTTVSRVQANAYKRAKGMDIEENPFDSASTVVRILANTVWIIIFGITLAIVHLTAAAINLALCVFVITIPVCLPSAMAHFKLISVAFAPFGKKVVPKSLGDEIVKAAAAENL